TLLMALALEGLDANARRDLLHLLHKASKESAPGQSEIMEKVRGLFQCAEVFDKAEKLIEKFRARAEAIADDVEPTELRELLYFLAEPVLYRQPPPPPEPESQVLVQLSK